MYLAQDIVIAHPIVEMNINLILNIKVKESSKVPACRSLAY